MKCADVEKRIYLYDELTAREREETDEHLKSCELCNRTMEHVRQLRNVVAFHRSQRPVMHNPSIMTQHVMNAIAKERNRNSNFWEQAISSLQLSHLRYAMAALSIILVSIFLVESADGGEVRRGQKRIVPGPTTALNLATFHSAFLKKKKAHEESPTLFDDCIAACLQNADANCKQCTSKFVKP